MADPIEEHIRKAQEEGKFDDLPGSGKPLNLEDNPHEDPDWRLAYHMLRTSGFTLPWIAERQEIETELEKARSALRSAWDWRKSAQGNSYHVVEESWDHAVSVFRKKVDGLNKKIFHYNLQTPSLNFQMRLIDVEKEIESVKHS